MHRDGRRVALLRRLLVGAERNANGPGREVLTGVQARSASATVAELTPDPSSYDVPPITTCSGTTLMPCSCTTSSGRYAVESVTIATRSGMGRTYRRRLGGHDVDQLAVGAR